MTHTKQWMLDNASLTIYFLPFLTAVAARLIFRRSNKKNLATLTALPFAVYLVMTKQDLLPDFLFDERHVTNRIMDGIFVLSITLLFYLCVTLFIARSGIRVADRIMRKNPKNNLQ